MLFNKIGRGKSPEFIELGLSAVYSSLLDNIAFLFVIDPEMILRSEVLFTLIGLATGLIMAWFIGIGLSINLFWGVLLVATGAIIGFALEWVVDETYRRDPELRRRLLEDKDIAPSPPGDEITAQAATSQPGPATELLADFLRQRETEVQQLRQNLMERIDQMEALRAEFEAYQRSHPDDLTVIKGIGPVYQRKLRDLGIGSYQQLAQVDSEHLRRLLDVKRWQRVEIESWVAQARDWARRG